ncbi:MAG: hypothetical protein WC004_01250 [Candidatus Absconditabacterales bacterium]
MNHINTVCKTMQVKLVKEKKDMYYAEAIGFENVFAQGKNPQDTLQNLLHVYEMMQGHVYTSTISKQYLSQLNTLDFTSITLDV